MRRLQTSNGEWREIPVMSAFDLADDGSIVRWIDYVGPTMQSARSEKHGDAASASSMSSSAHAPTDPHVPSPDQPPGSPMSQAARKRAVDDLMERSRCNVPGGCERELTPIPGRQGCCGPLTKVGYAHSTNVSDLNAHKPGQRHTIAPCCRSA
jgi:hypothetical protein